MIRRGDAEFVKHSVDRRSKTSRFCLGVLNGTLGMVTEDVVGGLGELFID